MTNPDGNKAAGAEAAGEKLPYKRPELTVFGSVRELTGGVSGLTLADGGISMSRMR